MAARPLSDILSEVMDRHSRVRHKRHAVTLAGITLPTKAAARDLIQTIKADADLDVMLPDEFTPVIRAILDWHPTRDEKLKHGCVGFAVRHNPPYRPGNDLGFWVVTGHREPKWVAFSYITCFQPSLGDGARAEQRLNESCRAAIGESQWRFKDRNFAPDMTCQRCHRVLTWRTAQVDHVEPKFRDIVTAFIARHGTPPPEALFNEPTYGWRFADPNDARYFAEFHDRAATRREVVCAACNMSGERKP